MNSEVLPVDDSRGDAEHKSETERERRAEEKQESETERVEKITRKSRKCTTQTVHVPKIVYRQYPPRLSGVAIVKLNLRSKNAQLKKLLNPTHKLRGEKARGTKRATDLSYSNSCVFERELRPQADMEQYALGVCLAL